MSCYYNYYLGYELDGKIYPYGMYDNRGKIHPVVSRSSRTFASMLHDGFEPVPDEKASEQLKQEFTNCNWTGRGWLSVRYSYLSDMPSGDWIKSGYFLTEDVMRFIELKGDGGIDLWSETDDMLYEMITPEAFAVKMKSELENGMPEPTYDCEGVELPNHSYKEYTFYAIPDYWCMEYEAFLLREVAYEYYGLPDEAKLVALLYEG